MAELLVYDFKVINANALDQALASNERRIAQHNARLGRSLGGTSVARSVRPGAGSAGLSREARDAARIRSYWERAAKGAADFRIRQDQRASGARIRQIAREEKARKSAADREAKSLESAARSLDRQRAAGLARQGREQERAARRLRAERIGVAQGVAGRIGGSVAGTVGAVGRVAGMALGLGGTFALASATQTQIDESARASQLANQAGKPEIKGEILRESRQVKGFTGMEALEGLGSFVDVTGDLDTARKALPELAQLSLATGAALNDLGAAAGNAFIPLADKIKDPQERLKALMATMRAIAGQGSVGAVEIKDMAIEMAGLAAATNKFKGDPAGLIKTVGAMAQAARQRGGAGTAAEASTSVSRFVTDLVGNQDKFKAQNIKLGDRDKSGNLTQLRDPQEIVVDVLKKTGGDLGKINKLFGVYAERAVAGFSPLFAQAEAANQALPKEQQQKKGVAGEKAVRAEFSRLLAAELSPEQQAERAASRLDDSDLKFKEASKAFNAEIGTKLLPVLTDLIPQFTKLIPSLAKAAELFAKLVDSVAKDPVGSIGKLIAAKIALDLAGAGIGAVARNAFERIFAGMPIPGVGAGAGGVAGGAAGAGKLGMVLGAAGIGAAIGAPIAAGIYTSGVANFEQGEASIAESGQRLNFIRELGPNANTQQISEARSAIEAQQEKVRELGKTSMFDDFMGLFGASNREVEKKSQETILSDMQAAFAKVTEDMRAAARAQTEAANKLAQNGPNRGDSPSSPVK